MTRREQPPIRVLPHNGEAEASILGGIILRNEVLSQIDTLETEDFYDNRHKVVFAAIRNLEAAERPIDIVTLENEIQKAGKLDALGGVAFLGELTLRVPTADNVEAYAKIVVDKRISREVIQMLSNVMDEAYADEIEGEQLCHDISAALNAIRTRDDAPIVTMAELIAREARSAIEDSEARRNGKAVYVGVPTGFAAIDHNIGGVPIGIPTLVIARPGNGKTTIAMAIAAASNRIAGMDSLLVSYEDGGQSFGQRGIAQESGISTELIRARRLGIDDIAEISAGWAASHARTESFLSASGMTVEALVRRVRRENMRRKLAGKKPLRQVIVDYVQKIPNPPHARTRDEGLAYISQQLSTMAVREDTALVVCCQLNREVERRDDTVPRLSDIRDSGALEQDGKLILGIRYPYYYDRSDDSLKNTLEVHCLKNHNGEAGRCIILFWDVKSNALYNNELDYQQARALRRRAPR